MRINAEDDSDFVKNEDDSMESENNESIKVIPL